MDEKDFIGRYVDFSNSEDMIDQVLGIPNVDFSEPAESTYVSPNANGDPVYQRPRHAHDYGDWKKPDADTGVERGSTLQEVGTAMVESAPAEQLFIAGMLADYITGSDDFAKQVSELPDWVKHGIFGRGW